MAKFLVFVFLLFGFSFALSPEKERQLLRDVSELKVQVAEIKATLKTFMEQTDKRFEQIDKRFEQVDKRFEQLERQIDRLVQIMVAIFAGQIALVGAVIGILIWDRRSMAKKAADEAYEKFEKGDFKNLINALRELAKEDERLERVLKKYNLM